MIDFNSSSVFKLSPIDLSKMKEGIAKFLITNEQVFAAFETIRDQVVFTDKRIIATNVQGITGSKVDYTSLPYNKISAFSIETAGTFDRDSELVLFISGVGQVKFEIKGSFDVLELNRLVSAGVLG